ncbi:MAG TPA: nuclear transport factor 2 family protein [Pyrinomonadaceae bacterium]|nr:nuclear transport factor 2 family protein [Pyrinomonadaceae bacterium]
MRRLMVCFALMLLAFVHTQAAPPTPGADFKFKVEEEILGLVRQLAEAQKNYDAAKLDEILAPDYIEVSPAGEVDSRAKVLGFYAPERKSARQGEMISYGLDEITSRIYGDTAIVVARLPFTIKTPDGQNVTRALRCTFVCRKARGKWRIASAQYTGIRPPVAAPAKS